MLEETILAATSASSGNPAALTALALVELSLAAPFNSRSQRNLHELIDKWGRTLQDVDPNVVDSLTAHLKAITGALDAAPGPFKQAS
jgi:hypothetical protein